MVTEDDKNLIWKRQKKTDDNNDEENFQQKTAALKSECVYLCWSQFKVSESWFVCEIDY